MDGVVEEDMKACKVDKDMIRDRDRDEPKELYGNVTPPLHLKILNFQSANFGTTINYN